ncbi:hypothetical protein AMC99_00640 [Altererythrobacter epoxidivorans]|uniref:WalW protein n=1 Tax=Altererythrobacter epoxidivorans TaxID=361183 RepID=A0A0M4M6M6_9SPHN|nr:polysaccharide deacetylase family protein [Altererythrobacter epoxidivorans]ALE15948.1 hypothetical protein AMC99_00640 [Altererythrobacter epoxidivorans]
MLEPPRGDAKARFRPDFGQRVLLTVDTEEEFEWGGAFTKDDHGLSHVAQIRQFQAFCEGLGVVPLYLVDWPIVMNERAVEVIGESVKRGLAEVGVQLHPWVNPPHEEEVNAFNSYAGNLPHDLERAKFLRLRDEIEAKTGVAPLTYRAGRYGLGPNSAQMLMDAGIAIDTSVRSNFDYRAGHGPDYSRHPLEPYWVDTEHRLLELPVTSVFWGMLRRQGPVLAPLLAKMPMVGSAFSRLGLLEKIPLTPEGVTAEEALRGLDMAIDDGLPIIVLSFHSPSLAVGHTPYVRTEDDLNELYDWFRQVYAYCERYGVKPTSIAEIMQSTIV